MSDPLYMWTIYDHPSDYPNCFVARQWKISAGETTQTGSFVVAPTLDMLRHCMLADLHLACIARSPEDDPKIVESWL